MAKRVQHSMPPNQCTTGIYFEGSHCLPTYMFSCVPGCLLMYKRQQVLVWFFCKLKTCKPTTHCDASEKVLLEADSLLPKCVSGVLGLMLVHAAGLRQAEQEGVDWQVGLWKACLTLVVSQMGCLLDGLSGTSCTHAYFFILHHNVLSPLMGISP